MDSTCFSLFIQVRHAVIWNTDSFLSENDLQEKREDMEHHQKGGLDENPVLSGIIQVDAAFLSPERAKEKGQKQKKPLRKLRKGLSAADGT